MAITTRPQDDRYHRFAKNYVKYLNIKKAYDLSGFNNSSDGKCYEIFHKPEMQELIEHYAHVYNSRLDISVEKILKHLAAIAFHNPLELIEFDEVVDGNGKVTVTGTSLKSPTQIPAYMGVAISSVKEIPSADGGISMEYKFENKTTALCKLLEYVDKTKSGNKQTTIVIKQSIEQENSGSPKIKISL